MMMLTDGVKFKKKEDEVQVIDLAELIAESMASPNPSKGGERENTSR
jgi:hypothetical protein